MTAGRQIDYEALVQEALRGVVRAVLMRVAQSGLPGAHHFYIAFDTQAPGVTISRRLKERYPAEMTIVLQHRFWDLEVTDDGFEVKLTFDSIPERLVVPFRAIKVFYDPSVPYVHQFEESELVSTSGRRAPPRRERTLDPDDQDLDALEQDPGQERPDRRRERGPKRGKPDAKKAETAPAESPATLRPAAKVTQSPPATADGETAPEKADDATPTTQSEPAQADAPASGAEIVDFSKFRRR